MAEKLTNTVLGQKMGVTSRQISKARRRGWIWKDDRKVKYSPPPPVFLFGKRGGKR